jgi:HEAT repeat protein
MRPAALITLALVMVGCGGSGKVEYSVPGLVKTLKDKDPNMRYWAAESLGHLGHVAKPAIPALIEVLKDEDKNVRMGTAYALAELGPDAKEALPALQEALRDTDKQVRDAAAYALKRIRRKK